MSLFTEIQISRIHKYAEYLEQIYDKENELDYLRDELRNLQAFMSQEDINEANEILRKKYEIED